MKKFYTLAAAAVLAMGASAQTLYLCGQGEGLAWTPDAPMEVALDGDNYTVTIKNLSSFKISTAKGTWDEFNAGAVTCALTEDKLGTAIELTAGDGNINTPWEGEYTLVVNKEVTTLTATTTTEKPSGFPKIYLRGEMNEWGAPDAWQMETSDGIVFWFDCQGETVIPNGTKFKIADAGWANYNYGAGDAITPFEEALVWNAGGDDGVMATDDGESYTGTIKAEIPTPGEAAMVTVFPTIVEHGNGGTGAVDNVEISDNAAAEYYNLQGVRVANPENGLYIVRRGAKTTKVLVK